MTARSLFLAAPLLLAACGQASGEAETGGGPSCDRPGRHAAVLTQACLSQLKRQVIDDRDNFFILLLDEQANHFVQGAFLAEDKLFVEVPGPRFASLDEATLKAIGRLGLRPDANSGNFVAVFPEAALQGDGVEKAVLDMAEALGHREGSDIGYEVSPLASPDIP